MPFTGANWHLGSATENATGATGQKMAARFSKKSTRFFKKSTPFFEKSTPHEKIPMRHTEKSGPNFSVCLISAQKRHNVQLAINPY